MANDTDPGTGIHLARLEATMDANNAHIRETLARIEGKLDRNTATANSHNERLIKLESDRAWQRKLAVPVVTVLVGTAATWVKGFLGLH